MNSRQIAFFSGFFLINAALAYAIIFFEHHHVHAENHAMENVQALVLAAGVLAHLYFFDAQKANGFFHGILSLLCFSFLLRELDVEDFPLPLLLIHLGSGVGRNILLLALWSSLAYRGAGRIVDGSFTVEALARRFFSPYFGLVFLLLGASAAFDQQLLGASHPRLFEELLEVNAYLCLVVPALRSWLQQGAQGLKTPESEAAG